MTTEDNIANKSLTQILKETLTKNFANGHGRASRREFWLFQLAIIISYFVFCMFIGLLIAILGSKFSIMRLPTMILLGIFMLFLIIPSICLSIRRLHDAGYSGWFLLLTLIPFLSIILLIFYCMPSQLGTNKFGPNPYETGNSNSQQAEENLKVNPAFHTLNEPSNVTPEDKTFKADPNIPDYKV